MRSTRAGRHRGTPRAAQGHPVRYRPEWHRPSCPARGRRCERTPVITSSSDSSPSRDAAGELVAGGAQLSAYGALLRNRNYRLWFLSSMLSSLGDWVGLFALQVLIVSLARPGSRLALFGLGGIMMARLLPSVVFGPVAGVLADRYDRKRVMVGTDVARAALFVGIAFSRDLVGLFVLTFAVECLSLLYASAKDASLPGIVPRRHLTQANQLNLLVTYGPLPFGAVVASAMVAVASLLPNVGIGPVDPTQLALLVNAATFAVGGLIIARVTLPRRDRDAEAGEGPGVMEQLREGVRFIRDLPLIRALITGVVGVFFGAGVVVTLGPEFVRSELGRSETDWYGLMTTLGAGLLIGIALVPLATAKVRKEKLFPVTMSLAAALATVVATLPSFFATQVVGFFLGALAGLSFVVGYTLLHEHTADEVRARTFAAFYTGTRVSMFAALGFAPILAGLIGTGTLILGGRSVTLSGIRVTIMLGGLVALYSAVGSGRRIFATLRSGGREAGPVRLRRGAPGAVLPGGLFVSFEGVEGSGKSTQIEALAETLRREGYDVLVTREPGGAPIAERIRALLLDPDTGAMEPRTEALLYAAARVEHVEKVILPALEAGKVVLCDRFVDSSLAYQGVGRGLGEEDVAEINRWATGGLSPDVVVLLSLDPAEGLRRVAARAGGALDRMEGEDLGFHRAVADGFLGRARRERGRFVVVDAHGDAGKIAAQVRERLRGRLPLPDAAPPGRPRRQERETSG